MAPRKTIRRERTGEEVNGRMRGKRGRRQAGQSILEYLVIATVIVAAILAISTQVGLRANNLYNAAANRVDASANMLRNLNVGNY